MKTKIKELSNKTSKCFFEIETFSDHFQKTKDTGNALFLDISKQPKQIENNKLFKRKISFEHNCTKKSSKSNKVELLMMNLVYLV